jgi:putative hydrolase of the HAD superfamily
VSGPPSDDVRAVVSDFGGVLTSPLFDAFLRVQAEFGVPEDALARALQHAEARDGANPLYELERGAITESEYLDRLERALEAEIGRRVELAGFAARFMGVLDPNQALFDYYRGLRDRGVRMALLTNNVREWEGHWRPLLPIDDVFELVVDSGFVGVRKPEREIYELTLSRLALPAEACAFVDDLEVNVDAARALGLHGIHYRDTDQAVAELGALLTA